MLIATLPKIHQTGLIEKIISHPLVGGVRYNTGYYSPYDAWETLRRIVLLTNGYHKKFWVDLEGRQIRVAEWSHPSQSGRVLLNHEIQVDCPAKINFRHDPVWYTIQAVRGQEVFIDPDPEVAVGNGQTVNVLGQNLVIAGNYLTEADQEFVRAAADLEIFNFMLSFAEQEQDLMEVLQIIQAQPRYDRQKTECVFYLKIESAKGLELVTSLPRRFFRKSVHLMAACDDLFTNLSGAGSGQRILSALEKIRSKDKQAIRASKIFYGLGKTGNATLTDWTDLYLMHKMGYRHFMFSDDLCRYHFDQAIQAWQVFTELVAGAE